jgi:hypothetical protein
MEAKEASPEEARTHFRQALWSVICAIAGWLIGVLGFVLFLVAFASGPDSPGFLVALLALACLATAPVPVVAAIGLGATAIRTRGNHLILATAGLILAGLEAGAVIGLFCLSAWRG